MILQQIIEGLLLGVKISAAGILPVTLMIITKHVSLLLQAKKIARIQAMMNQLKFANYPKGSDANDATRTKNP